MRSSKVGTKYATTTSADRTLQVHLAAGEEAIKRSVEIIEEVTGKKPVGFYAREPSVNTVGILQELKNFIYDSDA